MARRPRILQNEYVYHITCRTNNKAFRFQRKNHIRIFAKILQKAQEKYGIRIHHFVLMSNHYHLLVLTPNANISAAMQYINARVAVLYNRLHNRSGHLWGARFRSTIIDSEEAYLRVVRYLYGNPVRAGITRTVAEFEDSTFAFYAYGRKVDLLVDPDHLAVALGDSESVVLKKRARFISLVETVTGTEEIDHVRNGLMQPFFGSAQFLKKMKTIFF